MLKKLVIIILISFSIGTFAKSEIIGKGLICKLSGKPRISNYSDVVVFFNENKEVELNRIFRELDTFKSMKAPEITPGVIKGTITLKKVVVGVAPRLWEALIRSLSKPLRVAVTVITTNGVPSAACAKITPR